MLNKVFFSFNTFLFTNTIFFYFLSHIKMNFNLEMIKLLVIEDAYSSDAIYLFTLKS